MLYQAKAPGSLLLFGEYAVLDGHQAVVAAINQYIRVNLTPRQDRNIHIYSQLGEYQTCLDELKNHTSLCKTEKFSYILMVLTSFDLPSGCEIYVHADFSIDLGLGSSAAVTAATLLAIYQWVTTTEKKQTHVTHHLMNHLLKQGIAVIRAIQGKGSGADLAASLYGGVVAFQEISTMEFRVKPMKYHPPLSIVYSGIKAKTTEAITKIEDRHQANTSYLNELYHSLHNLSTLAIKAIAYKAWEQLGELCTQSHRLTQSLGISNHYLNRIVSTLSAQKAIWGAKTSGAGFGDCIIGIGELAENIFPSNEQEANLGARQLPLSIAPTRALPQLSFCSVEGGGVDVSS